MRPSQPTRTRQRPLTQGSPPTRRTHRAPSAPQVCARLYTHPTTQCGRRTLRSVRASPSTRGGLSACHTPRRAVRSECVAIGAQSVHPRAPGCSHTRLPPPGWRGMQRRCSHALPVPLTEPSSRVRMRYAPDGVPAHAHAAGAAAPSPMPTAAMHHPPCRSPMYCMLSIPSYLACFVTTYTRSLFRTTCVCKRATHTHHTQTHTPHGKWIPNTGPSKVVACLRMSSSAPQGHLPFSLPHLALTDT